MPDQTREVARALRAAEGDGGHLELLATSGDLRARAHRGGGIVDVGVPDGVGAALDDGEGRLGGRHHVGAPTLGPARHGALGGGVTDRTDGRGADELAVGVLDQPLPVIDAQVVVGVDEGDVGHRDRPAALEQDDFRLGREVVVRFDSHGVSPERKTESSVNVETAHKPRGLIQPDLPPHTCRGRGESQRSRGGPLRA